MNIRISILLVGLVTYLLVIGVEGYRVLFPSYDGPQAKAGYLDASPWLDPMKGTIPLAGEWEFYDGVLLRPADFRDHPEIAASRQLVRVPGNWNSFVHSSGRFVGYGSGTYRLLVQVDRPDVYSLRAKKIRLASHVFINGVDLGGGGTPALSQEQFVASNYPFTGTVSLDAGTAEIVIQVSNFVFWNGGLVQTPEFGFAREVSAKRDVARMTDMVLVSVLFTFGLYFAGMFRIWRQERYLVPLSLFCLLTGLFFSMDNEMLSATLFPPIPFNILQKMLYVFSLLLTFFFGRYVFLFLGEAERPSHRWLRWSLIACLAVIVVVPNSVLAYALLPSTAMQFAMLLQIVEALYRAWRNRVPGTVYVGLGVLFLVVNLLVGHYHTVFSVDPPLPVAATPVLLVFSQAFLTSLRSLQTYRERERLSRQLLEYDRLKDEFLAKTSHELRTPLHGVINLSQTMLDDRETELGRKHRMNVELLNRIGRRMASLVHDIMDMSQIKAGRLHLHLAPVDVRLTVRFVLDVLLVFYSNKNIAVTTSLPRDLPLVRADENRLRQVLHNLLENALKYTEQGTVCVEAEQRHDRLAITVVDTGCGIPPGDLERLFLPYEQAEPSSGRSPDGIGLGLSITKQLIELQEGSLEVHSEVGKGSRFTFTLPIAGAAAGAAETDLPPVAAAGEESAMFGLPGSGAEAEATVLLVDDEITNLKVLIDVAVSLGYAYKAVRSGEEALVELIREPRPDIVLLDLMMPQMSGVDVCRSIRRTWTVFEMPVLMLTASGQTGDIVSSFQAGANDIVQKPFEPAELKARIQSLLAMKRSVERAARKELDFLQAQITPHFLYNSLNAIMSLSYKNIDMLRETLLHLTTYLRAKFTFAYRDRLIPIERELEVVKAYVAIEQLRFGERLEVEFELDDTLTLLIPPLTIQPLVENAVQHGIGPKLTGGKVRLSIRRIGGETEICVEDDGVGIDEATLAELTAGTSPAGGVGIGNVNRRLEMVLGRKLAIESEADKGTRVKITLPEETDDQSRTDRR
ncbi:ATP-binding protein [Paenibacillus ginsengarvi]|nr:ATP-binding protein [Paenibacillus ginsengarvi]